MVDASTNRTTFHFDEVGRTIREVDPLGNSTTFQYDVAGQLTDVIDRLGRQTERGYDSAGRLVFERRLDGTGSPVELRIYEYDSAGRLVFAADQDGSYGFGYDASGRVTAVESIGGVMTFSYDAVGNRTRLEDAFGGVVTAVWDAENRLTGKRMTGSGGAMRWDDTLDALGRVVGSSRFSDTAGTSGAGTSSFTYDALGRTTEITHRIAAGSVYLANIWSVVETCRRHGHNVWSFPTTCRRRGRRPAPPGSTPRPGSNRLTVIRAVNGYDQGFGGRGPVSIPMKRGKRTVRCASPELFQRCRPFAV